MLTAAAGFHITPYSVPPGLHGRPTGRSPLFPRSLLGGGAARRQLVLDGPLVPLPPQVGGILSLGLLATNAPKYGAVSGGPIKGQVALIGNCRSALGLSTDFVKPKQVSTHCDPSAQVVPRLELRRAAPSCPP
jgi:hypothetical protein